MTKEYVDERLLTAKEFADFLNLKVSTVRAWCLRRVITFCRLNGRAVRIPYSEAQRLIDAGRVPARENKRAFE